METLVTLLLVLPMAGFALTALIGRRLGTRAWVIAVPVTSTVGFLASVRAAAALMLSRVSLLVLSVRKPAASIA